MGNESADPFVAVKASEVTDVELLPNLVRILTARVETTLDVLIDKVIPGIAQIIARLDDLEHRAFSTERRIDRIEDHTKVLESKLTTLMHRVVALEDK